MRKLTCAASIALGAAIGPALPGVAAAAGDTTATAAQIDAAGDTATTHDVWYGGPMLGMDAATIGLTAGGIGVFASNLCIFGCTLEQDRTAKIGAVMVLAGGAGYVLGAPIDHWVHGRTAAGFGSLALRAMVPFVAVLSASALQTVACGDGHDCSGPAVPLIAGGTSMVGIALADDILFAHGSEKQAAEPSSTSLRLAPTVSVGKITSIGVGGAF